MIHKVTAIVLAQRRMGEADKGVHLYTRELGRVWARSVSAARPAAKLVGATEVFVESEFSIFIRDGAVWGKVVGGRQMRIHGALWTELERTAAAAWVCEMVAAFTPERQAHPEKYDLLRVALGRLAITPRITLTRLAFAVRFLAFAGYESRFNRLRETLPEADCQILEAMHDWPWPALEAIAWGPALTGRMGRFVNQVIEEQLPRPLRTEAFAEAAQIQI